MANCGKATYISKNFHTFSDDKKNNLVRFENCETHIRMVVRLIFLAVFASFIGHIARYAPSSRDKNISKI